MTNTIELSRRLREAGIDPKHADAIAEGQAELISDGSASKADLIELSGKVGADLSSMAGRINLVDMKLNILLGLALLILGKLFFKG